MLDLRAIFWLEDYLKVSVDFVAVFMMASDFAKSFVPGVRKYWVVNCEWGHKKF